MSKKIEKKEELSFLKSLEDGNYSSIKGDELKEVLGLLKGATKNTTTKLTKRKAISIRLLEDDISRLKAISMNKGIPYQTFITELIHKYTTGQLSEHK